MHGWVLPIDRYAAIVFALIDITRAFDELVIVLNGIVEEGWKAFQWWALMMMRRVLPQWLVNTWPQKSYQTFYIKGFGNVVSILNNPNWAKI